MQTFPGLHIMLLILCALIFVGVVSVMFWSIFAHRRMKYPAIAPFHKKTSVEVVWTIMPLVIVLLMALPAVRTILAMRNTSRADSAPKNVTHADITVKATLEPDGLRYPGQYMWRYEYVTGEGAGIVLESRFVVSWHHPPGKVRQPLVVPAERNFRIVVSEPDGNPAYAWPVSTFKVAGVGTYSGFLEPENTEDMKKAAPVVVQVLSAQDYTQWVAAQKQTAQKNPLAPKG